MPRTLIDLTGQTFGRLTVLRRSPTDTNQGKPRWVCSCSCGGATVSHGISLRGGHARSCGCLKKDHPGVPRKPMVTYIGAHTRVHRERGKAKYYVCVDCGLTAQDWSYDGTDPDEVTGQHVSGSGHRMTAVYSLKPEHYSPRCKSCHTKFDRYSVLEGATK